MHICSVCQTKTAKARNRRIANKRWFGPVRL